MLAGPVQRRYVVLLGAWLLPGLAGAQALVSGTVRDSLTQQPLPGAGVFLLNTTRGTITDAQGRYVLGTVPPGSYTLAATYLGYRSCQQPLVLAGAPQVADVALVPAPQPLGEAVVKGHRTPRPRPEEYELFRRVFLGGSSFARQCRLLKSADLVVRFDVAAQQLTARTPTALEVENRALGYRLTFYDFSFRADFASASTLATTVAQVRFRELPGTAAQQQRWAANRQRAYRGSMLHFLRATYAGQVLEQGFRLQRIQLLPNRRWQQADSLVRARQAAGERLGQASLPTGTWARLLEAPTYALLRPAPLPADSIREVDAATGRVWLRFVNFLAVSYLAEPPDAAYAEPGAVSGRRRLPQQESVLGMRPAGRLALAPNGALDQALRLRIEGYWGFEKIGELLPLDYQPPATAAAP